MFCTYCAVEIVQNRDKYFVLSAVFAFFILVSFIQTFAQKILLYYTYFKCIRFDTLHFDRRDYGDS